MVIRANTSDWYVFDQVFVDEEYLTGTPTSARTIIDAGANVGFTSVYFARKFPGARIIAIEPEAENYKQLCLNVGPFPNVTPLRAAVWNQRTTVRISNPGAEKWAFQVALATGGSESQEVTAVSMQDLIDDFGIGSIDILKIDVEGSELEIFSGLCDWVNAVRSIQIELHDHLKFGASDAFFAAIRHRPYDLTVRGEIATVMFR